MRTNKVFTLLILGLCTCEIFASPCPIYGDWYERFAVLEGKKDLEKFGVAQQVQICLKNLNLEVDPSQPDSKENLTLVMASLLAEIHDTENFTEEFFQKLNFLSEYLNNDNPDVQIFFYSLWADDVIYADMPIELINFVDSTFEKLVPILNDNRRTNLLDLWIDEEKDYEEIRNIYLDIDFYSLPTEYERLIYFENSFELYEAEELKDLTKKFLHHFPENRTQHISTLEVLTYSNLIFKLLNSDHSNLISLIENKYLARTGSHYTEILETHYGYTYNYDSLMGLILNLSSYDFSKSPYKQDELLKNRLEWHKEIEKFATEVVKHGVYKDMDKAILAAGYDNWLSDTALKLSSVMFSEDSCKLAISFFDQAFEMYEYKRKENIFLYEDPYSEPIYAANCALQLNDTDLAKKYLDFSKKFEFTKPLESKFLDLALKLVFAKMRFLEGELDETIRILSDLNDDLFSDEFLKQGFDESEPYLFAINIYSELYKELKNLENFKSNKLRHPIEWLDYKYTYIENSAIISENLTSNNAQISQWQSEIKTVNSQLHQLELKFLEKRDEATFKLIKNLFKQKESLIEKIYETNIKLKSYIKPNNTDFKKFRENLKENEYILAYHFGPNESVAYLVSNTDTRIEFTNANQAEASVSFKIFNEQISKNLVEDLPLAATVLFRRFFKDILSGIDEGSSIFLYGSEFNHIPMNALSEGYKLNADAYQRMLNTDWLIKKYNFAHIEPFYTYTSKRTYQKKFLGIANPVINSKYDLPKLPSAEGEVIRLGITSDALQEDLLLGKAATFKALKNKLKDNYEKIVFATHAISTNDFDKKQSLLISKPDSQDQLFVSDIIKLGINADLVVLSSCFPGKRDADIFAFNQNPPLSRAFLISGASSVVSTTWEIDTNVSARITQAFFENQWVKDEPKFKALRQANLEMLYDYSSEENIFPKNWANFKITYKDHYSL